jgi:hypothetical protein
MHTEDLVPIYRERTAYGEFAIQNAQLYRLRSISQTSDSVKMMTVSQKANCWRASTLPVNAIGVSARKAVPVERD